MSDGTEFTIDIPVNGAGIEPAAAALANMAQRMVEATAATAAASEAMKAGQAAYNQAETNANRAALAVEKIGLAAEAQKGKASAVAEEFGLFSPQFQRASDKLTALTARQTEATAKAASMNAAMSAAATSLDTLRGTAAAAADNEARLGASIKAETAAAKAAEAAAKAQAAAEQKVAKESAAAAAAVAKTAKGTGEASAAASSGSINFRALSSGLGKLGGPLGSVGSKAAGVGGALQKLSKALGAAGPYVAAAVLAVALATAFAAATVAITFFAIASADTARSQQLLADGIAGSVKGGSALNAKFDDLANKVPIARSELEGMASELAKSGLQGEELTNALETAAIQAAKVKFGPDFAKEMLSLPNQAARLKSNISGLFSGLKIEALLENLAKLVGLFDKNAASGEAIKVVFESLFQPIVDGLTAIIPKAVSTFIQLEILALKAMIAIKPYGSVLRDIGIGFLLLGAVVVGVVAIFVAAGLAMVAAFAFLLALPFVISDAFTFLWNGITSGAGAAVGWLTDKFNAVMAFFQGLSLSEIGTQLIQGLVNGLTAAGPAVLDAITGIAKGAVDAAKKALGIKSPSTVFAEIGAHTAAGMEQGVDSGADGVAGSVEALVATPDVSKGGGVGGGKGGGGASFHIENLNVTAPSGADARGFAEELRTALADLLMQSRGGAPSAA